MMSLSPRSILVVVVLLPRVCWSFAPLAPLWQIDALRTTFHSALHATTFTATNNNNNNNSMSMMATTLRSLSLLLLITCCCCENVAAFALSPFSSSKSLSTTTRVMKQHNNYYYSTKKQTAASRSQSQSKLQMSVALGAITGAVTGGLFAGSLHAIAGPDHLAALLPRCCGQRWYKAARVGALWGMGHGVSATLLGVTAFFLKTRIASMSSLAVLLTHASSVTDIAVGLSLIVIGLLGIKEAREWEEELVVAGGGGIQQPQSLSAAAVDPSDTKSKSVQKRAVLFNGLLHGFSWDGAPSLAPALAVATWSGNLSFLLAYAMGTIAVMTVATTLIGEGTRRAGQLFNRPDIPQKISFGSSILAIAIGVAWCGMALS